ncbi:MAG: hypothetical protein EZS28_042116, partial [Streblomastix strix]
LRGGWIRNIRIVKEKGRRPWSAIQQRQSGQVGQQERQYHRFDLIEAETCLIVAQEIMLGVQQPQFLTQIQNLGLEYPWQKKYYVYHVWDGDMGNNYAKLPQSVINGLREEIIKRKKDAQKKLDDYLYGRIAQDFPQEMNEPNSRYSIRLFGCHTLSEAQEKFRTEFFDSMDLQFPVQSGVSTEQDADEAFLRRDQRRIAAQGGEQVNAVVPDDPKDLFDELNDDERFDQQFFNRNQNILPGLEFAHTYGRGRYYASLPGVQLAITELATFVSPNLQPFGDQELQAGGFNGINWATLNGGPDEAALRLKRAASVLSRIKREMIRQRSAAGPLIQQLCNQFNTIFTHPGLQQLNPQNVNNQCSVSTFALARVAVAIDPQSAGIIAATQQAGGAGNANAQQLLSIQTCELIMQCINSTLEPLRRDTPQYDLIQVYFLQSMNPAAINQPPGTVQQTFPKIESIYCVKQNDFEARFQECLAEQNRLLLWHGSGRGFWLSVLSTGLFLPGTTSFVSYGPGFSRPRGQYGIFFA